MFCSYLFLFYITAFILHVTFILRIKMTRIKPFKGIRPVEDLAETLSTRPYDVLSSEEARAEAQGIPHSLYRVIKPEIEFEPGTDEHEPKVYEKAVENFNKFMQRGWLVQDPEEYYYIYAQTMNGRTQYGFVVASNVEDYIKGNIKKHELTRPDKEEDRMKHVRINNANIAISFSAYIVTLFFSGQDPHRTLTEQVLFGSWTILSTAVTLTWWCRVSVCCAGSSGSDTAVLLES